MENKLMEAQIGNIKTAMQTFKTSIKMAAMEDDGKISWSEKRTLAKAEKAADRFLKEIEAIK